jgi:hypothetical protein
MPDGFASISALDIVAEPGRDLRSLFKLEQSLRDQIVNDLLQRLEPATGRQK